MGLEKLLLDYDFAMIIGKHITVNKQFSKRS